jgi:hypothetical protein
MKPIAAAVIICAGAYLLVAACQTADTGGSTPPLDAIGYATMAIGACVLFVGWSESKTAEKRLWQRFSIRDLFWLTLLAALLIAWWLDHQALRTKLDDDTRQFPGTISVVPVVG